MSDLVLGDDALDEAMLDPNLQRDTTITNNDNHVPEEAEIKMNNTEEKNRIVMKEKMRIEKIIMRTRQMNLK